jgi:hypothetical protein
MLQCLTFSARAIALDVIGDPAFDRDDIITVSLRVP